MLRPESPDRPGAEHRIGVQPQAPAEFLPHIQLPGQDTGAGITADLAAQILALDERLKQLDRQISDAFRTHPQAAVIESMPGIGPILGAEFLVAAGAARSDPYAVRGISATLWREVSIRSLPARWV